MKRLICILLAFLAALGFAGCRETAWGDGSSLYSDSPVNASYGDTMELLYCASDTFNPYSAATQINRQLCRLIFDPLIKLDNSFNPVFCLAASAEVSGTTCTVTLRDALFSDGSPVSASDVVYSFNLAKGSQTAYAPQLESALAALAQDSKTVVFKMAKGDPFFVNLLDFPVLKAGSEALRNIDSVALPPIGCGRYVVAEEGAKLTLNERYYGEKGSVKNILLINAPDAQSISHYVEIGAVDMYFNDISDGNIIRMSGKKADVNLNNLVYIGINDSYGDLSVRQLRYAISSAIDRKKICTDNYYNNARPATGFFNPAWEPVKAVQNIQISAEKQITIENLEEIGYNNLNTRGQRVNSAGSVLKFSLLVNSENRMRVNAARTIASQLSEVGISVTVVEKPYPEYLNCLQTGNFQLYLGEVKITNNMDLSNVVIKGGSVAYGIGLKPEEAASPQNGEGEEPAAAMSAADVINGFYSGTNTISDVSSILQTEMPIIPVLFRTGVLFYNEKLQNVQNSSQSDVYFSIQSYIIINS